MKFRHQQNNIIQSYSFYKLYVIVNKYHYIQDFEFSFQKLNGNSHRQSNFEYFFGPVVDKSLTGVKFRDLLIVQEYVKYSRYGTK